ncbi:N-terminal phage integrase SAM-like domain-containing protein [Streptomyces sp. NPDC000880]
MPPCVPCCASRCPGRGGRDPVTGRRKQLTVTKDTLKEARAALARIHSERSASTLVTPNKITLGEWLDEWLTRKACDVEPTTIRTYQLALVHVHDQLGHVRLQDLTEDHVQDFVDSPPGTWRWRSWASR